MALFIQAVIQSILQVKCVVKVMEVWTFCIVEENDSALDRLEWVQNKLSKNSLGSPTALPRWVLHFSLCVKMAWNDPLEDAHNTQRALLPTLYSHLTKKAHWYRTTMHRQMYAKVFFDTFCWLPPLGIWLSNSSWLLFYHCITNIPQFPKVPPQA